jgi:mono/diheme cytochrome c family protein
MREQESIRTYEAQPPEMPEKTIPVTGGVEELRIADPKRISNPLAPSPEVIERGRKNYDYFCVVCHGEKGDGNGTVGQSFAPLPTDLRSTYVQNQKDGSLFYRIIFGFKRHPPLYATIDYEGGWAVVHYIRSLGREP